jgi:hypothetical protein
VDLVWICRRGPNEELRYSIRSATENLQHDNIWVIGDRPSWYKGPFIPTHQSQGQKYQNAKRNLLKLILSDKVSDEFILMNDDFFVLKPVDLGYYYSGTISDRIKRNSALSPNAIYTQKLRDTMVELKHQGITNALDYGLHIPMKMNKQGLALAMNFPMIRTAYGNINEVGGEQRQDVKVYSGSLYDGMSYQWDDDSEFLSTDDGSFDMVRRKLLKDLFPTPTPYERIN